jgi:DNA-binding GntR family transcriptional regulator
MTLVPRPETLTSAVEHHIRDAIIRGDFLPGSPLPEIKLAEQLGTSRGTVREALRLLSRLGLVDIYPHRGGFVSELTRGSAADIYQVRLALEPLAVQEAVASDDFQMRSLPRILERFEQLAKAVAGGEPFEVVEAERDFHRETWTACPNELLREQLLALEEQTRRLLIYSGAASDLDTRVANHTPIVDAMRQGEAQRAAMIVRTHIEESRDSVLPRIPEDGRHTVVGE